MKGKGRPLSRVLLLSMTGAVTAVLLCAAALFFQSYRQSLISSAQTSGRRSIAQVSSTVENYLDSMEDMMELLESSFQYTGEAREDFFDVFLKMRPDVVAASTYDEAGELLSCYSTWKDMQPELEENLSFSKELMGEYEDGYISAPHVASFFQGYYPWVITMIAPVETGGSERWAALDISCGDLSSYINDVGIGHRGYCFLMDREGNIVYHPQQQLIYSELKAENTELVSALPDGSHVAGSVIYTVQSLENRQWRVVGVSFTQEVLDESIRELGRMLFIAVLIILLAALIISALLSRVLSRPIRELADAMAQFEQDADNFTYRPSGGVREVRALSESFSHMVLKIQQLVDTVRSEEINLRKTELRALQAQINPHFLYNTLDSISWMCERGKNLEAVRMVNALARLFRISISRGHELIPIRNELQHAESYLQIQSYRYKNQFKYSFQAEEDCLDYLCNKISLQPIIENAIYHGINGLVDEGLISVSVKSRGDDIIFTVADNGAGMDQEQIQSIMSRDRSGQAGIGIKNVDDRLKIYFGSSYGISIDSSPDVGTRVYITMPKVREEAEYEKR